MQVGQFMEEQTDSIQGELLPAAKDVSYQVYKSNQLIEAQYSLTANEQKLLNAAISMINPIGNYGTEGIPKISMSASLISQMTGIPVESVYNFVRRAATNFHSIPIIKYEESGNKDKPNFAVVNIALKSEWKNGEFSIKFHPDIQPDLINLQEYTKYALKRLKMLSSKYGVRLYELTQRYLKPNTTFPIKKNLTLSEVQFFLGAAHSDPSTGKTEVTKSYQDFGNFRKRVLDPAVKEVCKETDVHVSYRALTKVGRKITHLQFTFMHVSAESKELAATSDLRASLAEFMTETLIDGTLKNYSSITLSSNIQYLNELLANGLTLKSKAAFYRYLVKYDIASLPDVANPHSRLYKKGTAEYDFVNMHVMANWNQFPDQWRSDIQIHGLSAQACIDDFNMFKEQWLQGNRPKNVFQCDEPVGSPAWNEELKMWASSESMLDW
jgi:plasmid replication initiation protein